MEQIKRSYSGSITVEAAFVVPLVLAALVFLIYIGLYLFDGCLVMAVSGETSAIAAHELRCGYEMDVSTVQDMAKTLLKGKTVFIDDFSCEAAVEKEVSLTGIGTRNPIRGGILARVLSGRSWKTSWAFSCTAESPEEKLRLAVSLTKWKDLVVE